jgi:uncharacterized protein
MKKEFDPGRLDVRRFAEEGARLEGSEPLRAWSRLADEAEGRGADAAVHWSAEGELREPGRLRPLVWVHLRAGAHLELICQRCLNPVAVDVAVDRSFRFAPDEATAATEDDASEEDVLAESRSFDLLELVEDELLMAMPVVPRHEVCPETLPSAAGEQEFGAAQAQRENPFAVLGRLKGNKH